MAHRVLVVGAGNMGASHARAYHAHPEFDVAGIVAPSPARRSPLATELGGVAEYPDYLQALNTIVPDVVCISSYPDTHAAYAIAALEEGCHVFLEKPLATTIQDAREVVAAARKADRALVIGYILRVHPAWQQFTQIAQTLGKPLVMRMNLNQQSSGAEWETHRSLMESMSPIVDCGVHYVDVMCQMTRSRPVAVSAIGARLSDEIAPDMYNYGQLQVRFEDGSVGWYEAGWGPMMSETAHFVKDAVGPLGSVSIVEPGVSFDSGASSGNGVSGAGSADIDRHTATSALLVHRVAGDTEQTASATTRPAPADQLIDMSDEPDHQELCNREQALFLQAIRGEVDLTEHHKDAISSLRIVLAADESVRTGRTVLLETIHQAPPP